MSPWDADGGCISRKLTEREREVIALLNDHFSNAQIAEQLMLSEHTVRYHVRTIRQKIGVKKKSEIIQKLRKMGEL